MPAQLEKNFRIERLDAKHILLAGIGTYLLRLDINKEGLVKNMELFKVGELVDQRVSFVSLLLKFDSQTNQL